LQGALKPLGGSVDPDPEQRLGDYHLLGEIGRGGMGRVWRARQETLGREVALKTLRAGRLAEEGARARFRREAEAAARLRHPGIVPVYAVGDVSGELFLAMELVSGPSLAQRLREGPVSSNQSATWVRLISEAVEHAHRQGVIHRDLKPSNILLDEAQGGVPRLTDFGIAMLQDGGMETLTSTLEGLGTLAYLAPEQASGKRELQGPATDVYGLGAILFHCLTGRAPHVGDSVGDVLRQVIEGEIPSPRLLNPGVPRDLETLCLRCLEKDPAKRLPNASALAEELGRFLAGEPIRSRPVGWGERMLRAAARRPLVAVLAVLLAGSVVVGFGASEVLRRRAERESSGRALQLVAFNAGLARTALAEGDLGRAQDFVKARRKGETDAAGFTFEWAHLERLAAGDPATVIPHPTNVLAVAVSPDGVWMASGDISGSLKLRRVEDAQGASEVILSVAPARVAALGYSADSRELLVGCYHPDPAQQVVLRMEPGTGRRLGAIPGMAMHLAAIPGTDRVVFSASNRLYTEDNQPLRIWSLGAGQAIAGGPALPCARFAVSSDGRLAATFHFVGDRQPGKVVLWQLPEWTELRQWNTVSRISGLAFSPDGEWLGAAGWDGLAYLWNLREDGEQLVSRSGDEATVYRAAFVGQGEPRFVTCRRGAVDLWRIDRAGRRLIREQTLLGHGSEVTALAVHSATSRILSGANDGTARLWGGAGPQPPAGVVAADPDQIFLPGRFSGDGRILALAATNGMRLVEWPSLESRGEVRAMRYPLHLSQDGDRILGIHFPDDEAELVTWRVKAARVERALRLPEWPVGVLCVWVEVSPDGLWMVLSRRDGSAQLWNVEEGRQRHVLVPDVPTMAYGAAFSGDSRWVAVPDNNGVIRLWEVATGRLVRTFREPIRVFRVAFSPDGEMLASAGNSGQVHVWRVADGQLLAQLPKSGTDGWVEFSRDGRTLAKTADSRVHLFQVGTWLPMYPLAGNPSDVGRILFAPGDHSLWAFPERQSQGWYWRGQPVR
jgi:WD40 repeat protein